jgi:hypothetical protein
MAMQQAVGAAGATSLLARVAGLRMGTFVAGAIVVLCAGGTAFGQASWTVVRLHPPGATASSAVGVDGTSVVGSVLTGSQTIAALWNLPSNVPTDLTPVGIFGGEVAAAGGGQQVGYLDRNLQPGLVRPRAVLWRGTAASFVDLTSPVGTAGTRAFGVGGGQQVGVSRFGILSSNPQAFASLWSGTAESFVNLHDATRMSGSVAYATDGVQQVGVFIKPLHDLSPGNARAALWTGSAASLVNLHPLGATDSKAVAVAGGQQVGDIFPADNNSIYASLWTGSAASWVNLNPAGATASEAVGVAADAAGGMQVGWAFFDDGTGMDTGFVYASLWTGSAASWVNLSDFLPAGLEGAQATGIWTDGNTTRISGWAANMLAGGRQEALLWTRTLCPGAAQCCDDIDFNNNAVFPEDADVIEFFNVLAGAECAACNDIDFNNNGVFPEEQDVIDFFNVLAGGVCP